MWERNTRVDAGGGFGVGTRASGVGSASGSGSIATVDGSSIVGSGTSVGGRTM